MKRGWLLIQVLYENKKSFTCVRDYLFRIVKDKRHRKTKIGAVTYKKKNKLTVYIENILNV